MVAVDGERLANVNLRETKASWPFISSRVSVPSSPTNVKLLVVSRTSLGVLWNAPTTDGGDSILQYLVEWELGNSFSPPVLDGDKRIAQSVVYSFETLDCARGRCAAQGTSQDSSQVTKFQHHIRGLSHNQSYVVRVSACNAHGASRSMVTNPLSARPSGVLLFKPEHVVIQVGGSFNNTLQSPNRLELSWGEPTVDSAGFSSRGDGTGFDIPLFYRVQWSTKSGFNDPLTIGTYDVRMSRGDNQTISCEQGCKATVGAEVQLLRVSSYGKSAQNGSYKIAYVGDTSLPIVVFPSFGSYRLRVLSGHSTIVVGDYIRVDEVAYEVAAFANGELSISTPCDCPLRTGGEAVLAYYSTTSGSRISVSATAAEMQSYLEIILNAQDIEVSRDRYGSELVYRITFSGAEFSVSAYPLIVVLPTDDSIVGRVTVNVETAFEAGAFKPGEEYFIRVAAITALGIGEFEVASSTSDTLLDDAQLGVVPRAPPGIVLDAKVFARPSDATSLLVTWDSVDTTNGGEVTEYFVEFAKMTNAGIGAGIGADWGCMSLVRVHPSMRQVSLQGLTPGAAYMVRVRAVNDQGPSPPNWHRFYNPYKHIQDVDLGARFARPTCPSGLDGCMETASSIVARELPASPILTVPWFNGSGPPRTKDSVTIYISPPSVRVGAEIDKWKIEWRKSGPITFDQFDSSVEAHLKGDYFNKIMQNCDEMRIDDKSLRCYLQPMYLDRFRFTINGLKYGILYDIRVNPHNSLGYGRSSALANVMALASPLPPRARLSILGLNAPFQDRGSKLQVQIFSQENSDSTINDYLLELSESDLDNLSSSVQRISFRCSTALNESQPLNGAFNLELDLGKDSIVTGIHRSSDILIADSEVVNLQSALRNMANIGDVFVSRASSSEWDITFSGFVGHVPTMEAAGARFDGCASALVSIRQISSGRTPHGEYRSIIVPARDFEKQELSPVVIDNLVPGRTYFVRIAARNLFGFGPKASSEPKSAAPPKQAPGLPQSYYYQGGAPSLHRASAKSLEVRIGAPLYDGGDPLTAFTVEWDTSLSFDSGIDSGPTGQAVVDAATSLCERCVLLRYEVSGELIMELQNSSTAGLTERISVGSRLRFQYPGLTLAFLVVEVMNPQKLRLDDQGISKSFHELFGATYASLFVLDVRYIIDSLREGSCYFVRVSAQNSVSLGCGETIHTVPSYECISIAPRAPISAALSSRDGIDMVASWIPGISEITQSYRIERFTRGMTAVAGSFFGVSEVQVVTMHSNYFSKGYFTIMLTEATVLLPGIFSMSTNDSHIVTSFDITAILSRGDVIRIGDFTTTVCTLYAFNATHIPISDIYRGTPLVRMPAFRSRNSGRISPSASAVSMAQALDIIPEMGRVEVSRTREEWGFDWTITWITNVGNQPHLRINNFNMIGGHAVTRTVIDGQAPELFETYQVEAAEMSFVFPKTELPVPYYMRIVAFNRFGDSYFVDAAPLSLRNCLATSPKSVTIQQVADSTMRLSFSVDAHLANLYDAEWSSSPEFTASRTATIRASPSNQQVTRFHHVTLSIMTHLTGRFRCRLEPYLGRFSL